MSKIMPIILSLSAIANLGSPQIMSAAQVEGLSQKKENSIIEKTSYTMLKEKEGFVLEANAIKSINAKELKEKEEIKERKEQKLAEKKQQSTTGQTYSGSTVNSNPTQNKKEMLVTLTAYSSTVAQCDSNPFITASGTKVHEGTVAANFLPFGTKIKIPELYGDRIFVVEDRMASRFWYVVDVWMPSYGQAVQFGKKQAKIVVVG